MDRERAAPSLELRAQEKERFRAGFGDSQFVPSQAHTPHSVVAACLLGPLRASQSVLLLIFQCGLPQMRFELLRLFWRGQFVFGPFVNADFALVRVGSVFDSADRVGLECLALFDQLLDAF